MDTPNLFLLFVFVFANLAITAGYSFLSLHVVPKVRITLTRTKIGGVGFFLTCGLTHLHMAMSALFDTGMHSFGDMATTWLMLAIHLPQAIFVWMFVTGVYIEMGSFGLLRLKDDADVVLSSESEPGPPPP